MPGTLADVNPVAEVLSWLQQHSQVLAAIGGAAHITGLAEDPYPHIQVQPSPGGSYRDLRWSIAPEVMISTLGDVDGSPGQAALRRLHHIALLAVAELPYRQHGAGQTVVARIGTTSAANVVRTPLGSRGWVTTVSVVCHPAA